VPDVSWDADPNTGVAVYDSTPYSGKSGWFEVGGTSAGAPAWAGIVALVDQGRVTAGNGYLSTSNLTSSNFYSAASSSVYSSNYFDITSGSNGRGAVAQAGVGYDYVTGLGSPNGASLIPYLISH
jgi:subtilase family serine protease